MIPNNIEDLSSFSKKISPRKYSKITPDLKEFVITLHSKYKEIHDAFVLEMISDTTSWVAPTFNIISESKVPTRSIEQSKKRINKITNRYTYYFLSDIEVENLKKDPRVRAVEIPPEQEFGELELDVIPPIKQDTGEFHRRSEGYPNQPTNNMETHKNWAVIRSSSETNPYTSTRHEPSYTVSGYRNALSDQMILPGEMYSPPENQTYQYRYDGTGVDIVDMDSGIDPLHPEWEDADGNSRLKQIDWYAASTGDPWNEAFEVSGYIYFDDDMSSWILLGTITNGACVIDAESEPYLILIPNKPNTENYALQPTILCRVVERLPDDKFRLEFAMGQPYGWPAAPESFLTSATLFLPTADNQSWLSINRSYRISRWDPYYYIDNDGHGTHTASNVAGKIHGHAKNADIYHIRMGVFGSVGGEQTYVDNLSMILGWHQRKTNNRPTVLNCSWGIGAHYYFGGYFGLQNHDYDMGGNNNPHRIYQNTPCYYLLESQQQLCQYSLYRRTSPIKSVTVNNITYDEYSGHACSSLFGVISTGNENNVGFSNPRSLNRLFSAKFGLQKNTGLVKIIPDLEMDYSIYQTLISRIPNPDQGTYIQLTGTKIGGGSNFYGIQSSDNMVISWGYGALPIINLLRVPDTLGPCVKISTYYLHTAAIKGDGTVACWGDNTYGQCNVPSTVMYTDAVVSIDATALITTDGTIELYGTSTLLEAAHIALKSQPNVRFTSVCILTRTESGVGSVIALDEDGMIHEFGNFHTIVNSVFPNLSQCTQISGERENLLILTNDSVVAWGVNASGQCDVPSDLGHCKYIHMSNRVACVIKNDDSVVAWGSNETGQTTIPLNLEPSKLLSSSMNTVISIPINDNVLPKIWGNDPTTAVYYMSYPINSDNTSVLMDTIFEELIEAGVHICVSAGNGSSVIVKRGDEGWDDTVTYVPRSPESVHAFGVYGELGTELLGVTYKFKQKSTPHHDDMIVVGSINNTSYFKNRPIESISHFTHHGSRVDVYAPGTLTQGAASTYSSYSGSAHPYSFSDKLTPTGIPFKQIKVSGTSMSSPNVAGIVACIAQKYPNLTPNKLKEYLISQAKTGILKQQDQIDAENNDSWWSMQQTDGTIVQFNDFVEYPYGQKFTLGLKDPTQARVAYFSQDLPADVLPQRGWYKYTDINGYDQFILLPDLPVTTISTIINKIKTRIARGNDSNWSALEDPDSESLNTTGAHRVQTYLNETTPEE